MKTKKLFTSLAAAVMLSAGLAGSGVAMNAQAVHAADTTTVGTLKKRTVNVTVNSDKPKLLALDENNKITSIDSDYTKGQTIPVLYSVTAKSSDGKEVSLYFIETRTVNGKNEAIFIPATEVTSTSSVPTQEQWAKQMAADKKTVQDAIQKAYDGRKLKYYVVTPKSKKGAKVYNLYKKSKKSKKYYMRATTKKIKHGKKYKATILYKHGKTRYYFVGKYRYVKASAVKIVSAKFTPMQIPDNIKNMIEN